MDKSKFVSKRIHVALIAAILITVLILQGCAPVRISPALSPSAPQTTSTQKVETESSATSSSTLEPTDDRLFVSSFSPDDVFYADVSGAEEIPVIAPAEAGYRIALESIEHPVPINGQLTEMAAIYWEPVIVLNDGDSDLLVYAGGHGVFGGFDFQTLYSAEPGFRIIGLAEGTKFRVYWLETDGSDWALKTCSTLMDDEVETAMIGTFPSDFGGMRLEYSNWYHFAIPSIKDGSKDGCELLLYDIWDRNDDDFGVGKSAGSILLNEPYSSETNYRMTEGRFARPIMTDQGGAIELVPVDVPLTADYPRNAAHQIVLTGEWPSNALAVDDGVVFQVEDSLYKYRFSTNATTLIAHDVSWFSQRMDGTLYFAMENASTICAYNEPDAISAQRTGIIPLLHMEDAEFVAADISWSEVKTLLVAGNRNGEALIVGVQLSNAYGE